MLLQARLQSLNQPLKTQKSVTRHAQTRRHPSKEPLFAADGQSTGNGNLLKMIKGKSIAITPSVPRNCPYFNDDANGSECMTAKSLLTIEYLQMISIASIWTNMSVPTVAVRLDVRSFEALRIRAGYCVMNARSTGNMVV